MKTSCLLPAMLICTILLHVDLMGHGVAIVNGSDGQYLRMQKTEVNVQVDQQIAVVTSRQTFINETGLKLPIQYAFPLHAQANAIELSWYVNGQWHQAAVSTNTQSDTIIGEPGGSLHPKLLQYIGETPLLFRPLDSVDVDSVIIFQIRYVELLPYAFGEVQFFYPNDYSLIQPDQVVEEQQFYFHLLSDRTIEALDVPGFTADVQLNSNTAVVSFQAFENFPVKDLAISYQLSSTELGVFSLSTFLPDSLFQCDDFGQGYVSLIIEPESNANTEVIEKNFSLIIDRSGSMMGNKIVQARNAARFIVEHLNFGDHFNIVDFASNVTTLFPEMTPYSLQSQDAALDYIDAIIASGNTNISGALTESISQFEALDPTKANIIIFFTDGMATAGITHTPGILEVVSNAVTQAETEIYLFTFGIGSDVDKKLLTQLAQENNGLSAFLENDELEEKISEFFLTINNPVLLNTDFWIEPDAVHAIYPSPLPNLYKGQQLIISGRYHEPQTVTLHLTGNAFNLPVSYSFDIQLSGENLAERSFLPKIWAKQAIDKLTIDHHLAEEEDEQEWIQAIIDSISVCYGVISTEFTSFEDDGGGTTAVEYDLQSLVVEDELRVHPNPVWDRFSIDLRGKIFGQPELLITVLDPAGSLVTQFTSHPDANGLLVIDELKDLPSGLYYLILSVGERTFIARVIKS